MLPSFIFDDYSRFVRPLRVPPIEGPHLLRPVVDCLLVGGPAMPPSARLYLLCYREFFLFLRPGIPPLWFFHISL